MIKEEHKITHFYCDYMTAVNWCHNQLVLFNELTELDPNIWDEWPETENEEFVQAAQIFITDCSDFDVKYLQSRFSQVYFVWSSKFYKWFLIVDHYGTNWDYVDVEIFKRDDESEEDFKHALEIIQKHSNRFWGD